MCVAGRCFIRLWGWGADTCFSRRPGLLLRRPGPVSAFSRGSQETPRAPGALTRSQAPPGGRRFWADPPAFEEHLARPDPAGALAGPSPPGNRRPRSAPTRDCPEEGSAPLPERGCRPGVGNTDPRPQLCEEQPQPPRSAEAQRHRTVLEGCGRDCACARPWGAPPRHDAPPRSAPS